MHMTEAIGTIQKEIDLLSEQELYDVRRMIDFRLESAISLDERKEIDAILTERLKKSDKEGYQVTPQFWEDLKSDVETIIGGRHAGV